MYVLIERTLSGSTTERTTFVVGTHVVIVDSIDFESAKNILKNLQSLKSAEKRHVLIQEDNHCFRYQIFFTFDGEEDPYSRILGEMYNEPVTVLKDPEAITEAK